MRLTYGPWGETLAELTAAARAAERAGAEVVWVPELDRSATVTAAAMACATDHAGIGTAVTLAFTRSPMITALEALDIDDLSGGRFLLGLGSGVQRLNEDWHNARFGRPVAHLREVVRNLRHFWSHCDSGEPMVLDGEHEPMRIVGFRRPFRRPRADIPVYLAGMGPAMIRLAGEIGDGWIAHELCSPAYLRGRVLPELAVGVARVPGRERAQLEVVGSLCCSIDADAAVARRRMAGLVGFYASVRTYQDFFAFHDLAGEHARVVEAFRAGGSAHHLGPEVPDVMVDVLTASGTRAHVRDRLAEYEGLVDSVKLTPPTHGTPPDETRRAQREIIALIAEVAGGDPP